MKKNNLQKLTISSISNELCTGCGICESICPNSAIKLVRSKKFHIFLPNVDETKCKKCGVCYDICPGLSVNFDILAYKTFGARANKIQAHKKWLGNYINCFQGFSNDRNIRRNSSTGGVITQLLIYAIEEKIIDGVLLTKMKKDVPLEPEPFIAKTKNEIISAMKSKYCPVPLNIGIKKLISEDGKFAVVGLPCHIHGIRKAQIVNSEYRNKISLCLGLFCSHTVNFLGTETLLRKLRINNESVLSLSYRGDGWPGNFSVYFKKNTIRHVSKLPYREMWNSLFGQNFFTPFRCLSCYDQTNELADLSFGDAWLKSIMMSDNIGTSIIVSRSNKGDNIIKSALKNGYISISNISASKVVESQYHSLYTKKIGLCSRINIMNSLNIRTPKYYNKIDYKSNFLLNVSNILKVFNAFIPRKKITLKILKILPFKFLRLYGALLYYFDIISLNKIGDKNI